MYRSRYIETVLLVVLLLEICDGFNGLSDNIHFSIDWVGSHDNKYLNSDDVVTVMTSNKERYRCVLPSVVTSNSENENNVTPKQVELELLQPLFDQTSCTYRLEAYWTYELCHGKHLRQFHQENEKLQEYYLGKYSIENYNEELRKDKEVLMGVSQETKTSSRLRRVRGTDMSFYEMWYVDGTVCDLTGRARRVSVQYVCMEGGKGEVYEIKETSSCEYEAVVLTSLLCTHPLYGPKKKKVSSIQCEAVEGSPVKPAGLQALERENHAAVRYNSKEDLLMSHMWETFTNIIQKSKSSTSEPQDGGSSNQPLGPNSADQSQSSLFSNQPHEQKSIDQSQTQEIKSADQSQPQGQIASDQSQHFSLMREERRRSEDELLLKEFLEGSYCVRGGMDWWRHEFCFQKHVVQYHEDLSGRKEVVLGVWDTSKHLEWISNNPAKQPKPPVERRTVTHFYSEGDRCDKTGRKRFVEVRLKCSKNGSSSFALFLVEPKPCEYKLVVESKLLCPMIEKAGPFGLLRPESPDP